MKDSPQDERPLWLYQLASISIGTAAGFAAGWLITAAFSITTEHSLDIPSFEDAVQVAVPSKTIVSDVTARAIDPPAPESDQPKLSEPAIVPEQPTIVPAPAPFQVAEIVPLPPSRPRSVPLPRPRPMSERRQALVEPQSFLDFFRVR
jgi:hypothetical protein